MAKYPPEVWAGLWIKNGGLPSKTREAVATVMCESNGDTDATSPVGARGGWQFMPGTLESDKCARDPDCSTREAVKLSDRGKDFSAWDCHPDSVARSGTGTGDETYRNLLANLKIPIGPDIPFPGPDVNLGGPFTAPYEMGKDLYGGFGIDNPADALKVFVAIPAFFKGLGELILTPEGWLRTGKLVGGSILIMWGLKIIVRESTVTVPGAGTASKVKGAAAMAAEAAILKKVPLKGLS